MLTFSIAELEFDGLVPARVTLVLISLQPTGRYSIHGVQIEFLATAIGCQSDCSCQICVTF